MKLNNSKIRAGTTFDFTYENPAYVGYEITIFLIGPTNYILTAVNNNNIFVDYEDTAIWQPGVYQYIITGTLDQKRVEIENGKLEILTPLADIPPGKDNSTHAERTLAAIEAVIENRASNDQQQYKIAGRELTRIPLADLLIFRDYYKKQVSSEKNGGRKARRLVANFL